MQRRHLLAFAVLVAAIGFLLLPTAGQAGAGPSISWSPQTSGSYNYGTVTPGTTVPQTFTLRNSGGSATGALTVRLTGSTAFAITSNGCTAVSIGPKKSCQVTVSYSPSAAGATDTATLTATSKKPPASAGLSLTGKGTPATGAIVITKVASGSTTGLSGAHFTVDSSGDYVTGSDGTVCVAGLAIGSHTVTETTPPSEYDLASPASQSVDVTGAGTCAANAATATFEDPPTNLVLNPGFEDNCSGIPCHWSAPLGFGVISRDTNNPHSGSASVRVNATGGPGSANSDCITISPNTTYNISGWYRTITTAEPTIGINEYSDASCSQPDGNDSVSPSSLNFINIWSLFGGPLTTVSDAASAQVFVELQCQCLGGGDMHWDDVSLTRAP
jgi:hypothetical protein